MKVKISKDQILAALPNLQKSDLEAIHAISGSLLAGATGASASSGAVPLAPMIFDALVSAVGATTAYSSYSPTATRQFEKRVPDLTKFLDAHFTGWDNNKVGQIAVLRMLFGLIADDLRGRGVNPTIGMLVVNMGRIAEVFENAFPGYLESGIASVVLKNFR